MDAPALRAQFPVLERTAYLNAGTTGPIPRRAAEAAGERWRRELERGRSGAVHFLEVAQLCEQARSSVASLIGAHVDEIALTRSTTEGANLALAALALGPRDEVLTSDEEHPGLLAPLAAACRRARASLRVAPFADLAAAVAKTTTLVATSHVSWMTGAVAPIEELRASGVPLLLDGAQALGAIEVDVRALGCDFYAASGQKWLCGPDWTGYLFARAELAAKLEMPAPGYMTLRDPTRPLELLPHSGARRLDAGLWPGPAGAAAVEALGVLEQFGWREAAERARTHATKLRSLLADKVELVPGGATTLVSWHAGDSEADVERLAAAGVVVRSIPGRGWLRASVGAWNADEDLDRLADAA